MHSSSRGNNPTESWCQRHEKTQQARKSKVTAPEGPKEPSEFAIRRTRAKNDSAAYVTAGWRAEPRGECCLLMPTTAQRGTVVSDLVPEGPNKKK
ncbi:hypothetical protein NDU88_000018 [Pleurodeles waltl]|uniref:Uncharacterized protein n=1 Tax=Pleurodeles waltl TaxID=8319 RepID=A0AAV7N6R6_PLEWA|nr:hypothetical protein NDU88_000018 [Pleurodeles waltl]